MARRVSSAAIGGFVAAGFGLLLLAIVVVGAGTFFKRPVRFVCMFQGDVNGLRVGAPVKFKGVQIGSVEEIKLRLKPSQGTLRPDVHDLRLPVIIGIDRSIIMERGATGEALSGAGFDAMISRGLRAQLNTESLLTGLLYVDLDLHPNSPVNFALMPGSGDLPEIPTIPTTMEAIQKQATEAIAKLDTIDLKALVTSISGAANSINQLAASPDLKQTLAGLKETIPNTNETITSVRASLTDIKDKLIPLAQSIQASSLQANATMRDTSATLSELRGMLEPDAPLSVHLNEALDEMTDTTRSLGTLSDYLQRNPAALVRGKYVSEKAR